MKTFAIMIIWFGSAQYGKFDTETYPTMAECLAARDVLIAYAGESWMRAQLNADVIECREVRP